MTTPTTHEELIAQIADAIREVQFLYTPSDPVKLATAILDRVPILDAALYMLAALEALDRDALVDEEDIPMWIEARAAIKKARGE